MSVWIAILIAGAAQALILSIAILKKRQKRLYPLLLLLLVIGTGLALRIAYSPAFYLKWVKLVQFSDLSLLLYGPVFWLFIKSTTQALSRKDSRELLPHGLPVLVFLLHFAIVILPLSNRDFVMAENAGQFNLYYSLLLGAGILLNAGYWYHSFRHVSNHYRGSKKSESFLKFILVINAIAILAWAVGFALSFGGPIGYTILGYAYQIAFLALAMSSIVISFHALSHADFWLEAKSSKKYAKSRLSVEDINKMGEKLEAFIEQEHAYLDPAFTLDQLSKAVQINKVQLSQVINQYMGKGFADWLNEYRVEVFIEKAESGNYPHLTLFGMAMESGFKTKATFNKAFKKAKGVTPSQYIGNNSVKKEPVLSN